MASDLQQSGGNRDLDDDAFEPPQIRRFRRLVSLLMIVMMIGILGIAGALVYRLTQPTHSAVEIPNAGDITVPAGMEVLSITQTGTSLYLVLENTETGERRIEERSASDQTLTRRYRLVPVENN